MDDAKLKRKLGLGGLGAGALGLITFILQHVTTVTDQVRAEFLENITLRERSVREYVDLKHEQVTDRLDEMSFVLKKIDERLYELHRINVNKGKENGNSKH